MPDAHAPLSPSAAARWTACPASVRLAAEEPESTSIYAEQGTAAHAYAEILARRGLLGDSRAVDMIMWDKTYRHLFEREDFQDMQRHTHAYVDHLRRMLEARPGAELLLERQVKTGIPSCWGTADAVIVSDEAIEVIDLKYGAGVPVSPVENSQLKLYGVGALEEFDILGDVEVVGMTIFQPRVGDGHAARWEMPADELRVWRDSLLPVATEALAGSDRFGPSAAACRWCPVAGKCRAQAEAVALEAFPIEPETLSPEEVGDALAGLPALEQWIGQLRAHALDEAHTKGHEIPGWKVVAGRSIRKISDPEAALGALTSAGWGADAVTEPPKLLPLGKLEKLVGKAELPEVLSGLITKPDGKPTLVPSSDPREALSPPMDDFDTALS